jgi:rod shape determining protein RodA
MDTLIEPRLRKNVDWSLIGSVVVLMGFSLLAIYLATLGEGVKNVTKQAIAFGLGLILMVFVASRDYTNLARLAPFLYGGNLVLLLLVRLVGKVVNGARRWIDLGVLQLQPSELAKICLILTLSIYLHRLGPRIREFPVLMKTLVHTLIPMAMIIALQKDLGTGLVLGAIWLGMVFLAGADWRHLAALLLGGFVLFAAAYHFHVLHPYQIKRVMIFLGLIDDPRGTGYHILQSLTAIGGGQVTGQGLGNGLQTQGNLVPEHHTDFIFTVVGEETGFLGACVLLVVYGILLQRGVLVILGSEDHLGRLIAGGVVTLFSFHLLVNVGMTCGIVPVVGVPLPLMSYGGSAAIANLTAVGLLLSVSMRRRRLQF